MGTTYGQVSGLTLAPFLTTLEEAKEGRDAFLEKRPPDFKRYRRTPW
ncbi:MAG: hypothetical protein ACE5IZ_04830 [Dehalococcoidia bacterium]